MNKKLYKSKTNKKLCGVCGGIAEYFDIDATIVRLLYFFVSLLLGVGLLGLIAYFAMAVIIPDREI